VKKRYIEIKTKKKINLAQLPVSSKQRNEPFELELERLNSNRIYIEESQTLLYANGTQAMLIIFQGMDTAGKDGAIKHVMSGVNPQGCSVTSFKKPTSEELNHDFLWQAHRVLPVLGQIGIFNRSYYEEVLVTKVHPELLEEEKIPLNKKHIKKFWEHRYHDIVNFEKYLHRQGYEIIKIFLHISKDEQKRRLLDRFSDPKKLWKISDGDIYERKFWNKYQTAYEECIRHTSSKHSPWYIVPSNDKKSARLSISQILVERFKQMHLEYPVLKQSEKEKLKKLKSMLEKSKKKGTLDGFEG
jgi:PPK2 family polyphosphate:nucleotide phosphotransferase